MPDRRHPVTAARHDTGHALALLARRGVQASLPLMMLAAVLSALLAGGVAQAADSVRLNFGVYSSNKPSAMVRVFKPALQELEQRMSVRLGREVDIRMQIARDYERGITDLTDGRVDFSRFGPASYIEAKKLNSGIRILTMENEKNSRVFYGIIAVRSDSDIQSVDDLHGRSFAFGDEGSTIGRFLSQLYLEKNGIRAGNLSRYEYLGRHDRVGTAVGAGDFDAGALNEKTFKQLVAAGENIRELARFPNVTKPWIARAGLDPEIFEALQASLLEINDAQALAELKIDGFLSGSDADYNDIRVAIEDNAAFFSDPRPFSGPRPVSRTVTPKVAAASPAVRAASLAAAAEPEAEKGIAHGLPAVIADGAITRSGNRITINIMLPPSLFVVDAEEAGGGAADVTINLTIPDARAATRVPLGGEGDGTTATMGGAR